MAKIICGKKTNSISFIDNKSAGICAKAFTLIEVLCVAVFLSIISMAVIQGFEHSVKKEKEERLRGALNLMRSAVDRYYLDRLTAAPELTHEKRFPLSLEQLVNERYLRSVPQDPIANGCDWEIIYVSETEKRVFDFKSKARGIALDGTLYSDW